MTSDIASPVPAAQKAQTKKRTWLIEIAILLVIFGLALAVRTYRLHEFPPGLHNDEAANGLDVLNILEGKNAVFFPRNQGREPLFIYLQAAVVALLGATPYALRLTAAIVGALAVPAAYWMVREAFAGSTLGARRLATWTALFMAFGYWHISMSRIGFRANMLPLLAAITFALFWRAWRKLTEEHRFPTLWLVLTGVALGISLYTYTAARMLPVLVVIVAGFSLFQPGMTGKRRLQVIGAVAVIAVASAVVFAPLGLYYIQHPDAFIGRTAAVFVFNPSAEGDGAPATLPETILQTVLMFFTSADPNLRHNPVARPATDFVLGLWLVAGIVISVIRWRRRPYFFLLAWFVLFSLPAVLSSEGIPHSLRAIGMIPIVYVLPVVAMVLAGQWLARRWHILRNWLPLPFLLFSAATSVYSYFSVWSDLREFDGAFLGNYVQLAKDLGTHGSADSVWLLPLSPNYFNITKTFLAIDFLYDGAAGYTSVYADPETAAQTLEEKLKGYQYASLLRPESTYRFMDAGYILGDPKNLVKFLLDKYGVFVAERNSDDVGMPYLVYEVPEQTGMRVAGTFAPRDDSFDGKVKLTGVDYGRAAGGEAMIDATSRQIPAGSPIWVVLQWVSQAPIDYDLKTSLILKDEAGHLAGQIDDLLVDDLYPFERMWAQGGTTNTYHVLPTLPAIPPGKYQLFLKVYEDKTLRPYPKLDAQGNPALIDVLIGSVDVTPATRPQTVAPQYPLRNAPDMAPDLKLIGYDLPVSSAAPGGQMPVTLFWQASEAVAGDYEAELQLRTADGDVAARSSSPIGGAYPTSQWRAQDVVRDWQDLAIAPTLANGQYELWIAVNDGAASKGEMKLGDLTVEGRPHTFEIPPIGVPAEATFGNVVDLLGLKSAPAQVVQPGEQISVPLVWRVAQPTPLPLVRFVHLLGADGVPLTQADGIPCAGACPASTWVKDEILDDELTLTIPPDAKSGDYTLVTGWYDQNTLQRLPAVDGGGGALVDQLMPLPVKVTVVVD